MAELAVVLLVLLAAFNVASALCFVSGLRRVHVGGSLSRPAVSVIIAVRNEEANLGDCIAALRNQSYDKGLVEILVVDDDSTDRTHALAGELARTWPNLRLLRAEPLTPDGTPKVNALATGLAAAKNEILLFTDADCRASPKWIERMVSHFDGNIGAVFGFSLMDRPGEHGTSAAKNQSATALWWYAISAGANAMGFPLGASGGTMGFRKSEFLALGGYDRLKGVRFGDDVFILQLWHDEARSRAVFVADADAVMYTKPTSGLVPIVRQMLRWLKPLTGLHVRILAYGTFLILLHWLVLICVLLSALGSPIAVPTGLSLLAIIMADGVLVLRAATLLRRTDLLLSFLPSVAIRVLLLPIFALAAQFAPIQWRGRQYPARA